MEIPVKVNGKNVKFLMDTGIGPTVLSKEFLEELGQVKVGVTHGKRMSGQELEIPLFRVPSIEAGGLVRESLEVGMFDTSGFPPVLKDIKGILSIGFFRNRILTMDYPKSTLNVSDSPIEEVAFGEDIVPVEVEYDGPSVSLYLKVRLPSGKVGRFEVDTGSDVLILNSSLMGELGVDPKSREVEEIRGTDETGNGFTRYFTEIRGRVSLNENNSVFQENPRVMFQDIIYDGLIGHDFLKRYTVSFDIENSRMSFSDI